MGNKTRNGQGFLPHALALSLLLHLAALSGGLNLPTAGSAPSVLVASLRAPLPELPAAVPPAAVPPAPTLPPARPLPAVARVGGETPAPAERLAVPAAAAPGVPVATGTAVPVAAIPAAAAVPSPAAHVGEASPVAAVPPPAPGPDADGLRSYRLALAREARRFKRYPREAQAAGWTGTAEIRLDVGAGGAVRPPSLSRSSGRDALDGAALAMVAAAAQAAPVPASLRGQPFAVTLPVVFDLDD